MADKVVQGDYNAPDYVTELDCIPVLPPGIETAIVEVGDGNPYKRRSPWYRKYGETFKGMVIPPGCGVFFTPAPTKYENSKVGPTLQYGIFMGYEMQPGGIWSGRYLVCDIDDFTGCSLAQETHYSEFDIKPPGAHLSGPGSALGSAPMV